MKIPIEVCDYVFKDGDLDNGVYTIRIKELIAGGYVVLFSHTKVDTLVVETKKIEVCTYAEAEAVLLKAKEEIYNG